MKKTFKVLDCTLRDGGYYNKWDFSERLVERYLEGMTAANIDIVEIGFRNFPKDGFFGACFYSTDNYIDSLDINSNILVGVMVDASSILTREQPIEDSIDILFKPKCNSRVDLVRIAAHLYEVQECERIAQKLKSLGYQVGLNLMQVSEVSSDVLLDTSKLIYNWEAVDVLYFADSLGCMDLADIERITVALMSSWKGCIGFHAHNNRGFALANSLAALENGVDWIDCTVLGMGRGAGNAPTENLIMELTQESTEKYCPKMLYKLSLCDFSKLKEKYHWGNNILYAIAAVNRIHPTYIQEMLSDGRYGYQEALRSVNFISNLDARYYDKNLLLRAKEFENRGTWSAKSWCSGKSVMILGSGKSLQTYYTGIVDYIRQYSPIVISLDVRQSSLKDVIDVYVLSNESKMLSEFKYYSKTQKPLITPVALLSKVTGQKIQKKNVLDYGLNIKKGVFEIKENECTLPYELSVGYALSCASIGGAKEISLVGFDGFDREDVRQEQMNEIFELYNKSTLRSKITALTPTTYRISKGSIYAGKK